MRCLHYPISITTNWWPSVDARLMVISRMGPWPCHFLYCPQSLPIHWFQITVSKSLTNYLIYKTNNLWGSSDTHFQNGEVNVLLALLLKRLPICWLLITASISLSNYLTYITKKHWRSVDDQFTVVETSTLTIFQIKAAQLQLWVNAVAQPLDYTRCNAQNRWCSVDALLMLMFRCSDIDSNRISHKGSQYFNYGWML